MQRLITMADTFEHTCNHRADCPRTCRIAWQTSVTHHLRASASSSRASTCITAANKRMNRKLPQQQFSIFSLYSRDRERGKNFGISILRRNRNVDRTAIYWFFRLVDDEQIFPGLAPRSRSMLKLVPHLSGHCVPDGKEDYFEKRIRGKI